MHPYLRTIYAHLQGAAIMPIQAAVPGHRVIVQTATLAMRDGFGYLEGIDAGGLVLGVRGAVAEAFNVFETIVPGTPFVIGEPGEGMQLRMDAGDDSDVTITYYVGPA
jgi:hypothetical protein